MAARMNLKKHFIYAYVVGGQEVSVPGGFQAVHEGKCDPEALECGSVVMAGLDHDRGLPLGYVCVRTPIDLEVHKGYDGRYWVIDTTRIFPCEVRRPLSCHCSSVVTQSLGFSPLICTKSLPSGSIQLIQISI